MTILESESKNGGPRVPISTRKNREMGMGIHGHNDIHIFFLDFRAR